MKITYVVTECRDKVSPNCTKTFNREVKRGRPQLNCHACKSTKVVTPRVNSFDVPEASDSLERTCGCGSTFTVKTGRGRKAGKCGACRSAGIVYRRDDDGVLQEIRAETLRIEQQEIREENGRIRAQNLFDLMAPLIRKRELAS